MLKLKSTVSLLVLIMILTGLKGVTQEKYDAPGLTNPKSWSMILLPDPQGYTKFARNQPLLEMMTGWISAQKQKLNIKLVLCTGDLVEQNFIHKSDSINGDQPSSSQWAAVSKAFSNLDNSVPYILCTGNHDYGTNYTENRYSQFNSYFPPERNQANAELLVDMAPSASGVKTLENACYELLLPEGRKMLIFSLEYAPRASVVQWASEIASRAKYAKHIGVVLTHSYMDSMLRGNVLSGDESKPAHFKDATTGADLWKKLIFKSGNIQMVYCGHVVGPGHQGHVGFRRDKNSTGIAVNQMLFNAQNEGGNWQGNGGDGWLRILEFLPDGKTVLVKTFSPLLSVSPSTRHLAWRKENFDQFAFQLDAAADTSIKVSVPKGIYLSNYLIKQTGNHSIATVKHRDGVVKQAKLVSDTSGLFSIDNKNRLKLKVKPGGMSKIAMEYQLTIQYGTEILDFILVKDEFIKNKVVAHRGAWKGMDASRNSLKSLQNALDLGCEAAEFDVWLSKDSIPVVSHDGIIGGKAIEETLAGDLRQINIGHNDYLPTLEQYLRAVRGQNKTHLFLEIKSSDLGDERTLLLTRKAVAIVQAMKMQAWVKYISFNYRALQHVLKLDPGAQTAYLWGDRSPEEVIKDGLWGIDYPYDQYFKNPQWVEQARKSNLNVNVWTVNDPDQMKKLLDMNVDLITTDEPGLLLKIIKKK